MQKKVANNYFKNSKLLVFFPEGSSRLYEANDGRPVEVPKVISIAYTS